MAAWPRCAGSGPSTSVTEIPAEAVAARIAAFKPQAILYRPLPDRPGLHRLAMEIIAAHPEIPLVTWMMDDWPARLAAAEPARFAAMDADLGRLFARSALRLAISGPMAAAYGARYGHGFQVLANGIDPADWPEPRTHREGPVLVRYAGGLAPDMNAESIARLARAVEARAKAGQDVRLEINTQAHWLAAGEALAAGLPSVTVGAEARSFPDYARWLCEADVLVVAYNFDPASRRYVRYSMANKLPECLASGAALLLHGPSGLATTDRLAGTGGAEIVAEPDQGALEAALARLADPARRRALAEAGRALALRDFALPRLRDGLRAAMAALVAPEATPSDPHPPRPTCRRSGSSPRRPRPGRWSRCRCPPSPRRWRRGPARSSSFMPSRGAGSAAGSPRAPGPRRRWPSGAPPPRRCWGRSAGPGGAAFSSRPRRRPSGSRRWWRFSPRPACRRRRPWA